MPTIGPKRAKAITGVLITDSAYPTNMSHLCRPARSQIYPERYLKTAAVASAAPSMRPRKAAARPRSCVMKIGSRGNIISDWRSAKKDTRPRINTLNIIIFYHRGLFAARPIFLEGLPRRPYNTD